MEHFTFGGFVPFGALLDDCIDGIMKVTQVDGDKFRLTTHGRNFEIYLTALTIVCLDNGESRKITSIDDDGMRFTPFLLADDGGYADSIDTAEANMRAAMEVENGIR